MVPGGVCAHLEYQIEDMTDYVSEMTQRLVDPTTPVTPEFRKFVLGLLSSTRLPHTTILLGMNYLALRISKMTTMPRGGHMWRLLTVALLLGSKFLDDNTFQNKSWSEVSGIAVLELNKLEHSWLEEIHWSLFVDLDRSTEYQAWLANWKEWAMDRKKVKAAATLERLTAPPAPLAPIDTNVSRPRPSNSVYRGYPQSATQERQQYVPYEHPSWNHSYPTPQHTPPSAPDSGVTTPEYLSATGPAQQYDWGVYNPYAKAYGANTPYVMPDMSTRFHNQWPHQYSPHQYSPHHYSPQHYFHQYSIWNHQPSDYAQAKQPYFMPHNAYGGHQTAVS